MAEKLMSIEVRGRTKTWCFSFYADPKYVSEWQEDGLNVVLIEYVVPMDVPLPTSLLMVLQDLWNFRNPWRKP